MTLARHGKALAVAGVAAAVVLTAAVSASGQERVRWKMQSAFGSQLSHLGTAGVRLLLPLGFEASVNGNFVGSRFVANDLMNGNQKLPRFASYDARLAWKHAFSDWLTVEADVTAHNLTNRRYTEFAGVSSFTGIVGFFPSPDRHYVAGLRVVLER